jgi:hypothetical protein
MEMFLYSSLEKIRQLSGREWSNRAAALEMGQGLSDSLKYHQLTEIQVNLVQPEPNWKPVSLIVSPACWQTG